MSLHHAQCQDLVIALGQTTSRWVNAEEETSDALHIGLQAPTVMAETLTIEVSDEEASSGIILQGVVLPAAGQAVILSPIPFKFWRLVASVAVAAERTVKLSKLWEAW